MTTQLKRKIARVLQDKVMFFNCDIQDGPYLISLFNAKAMIQVAAKLMKYAKIMNIPVLVSHHNRKTFGDTCNSIKANYGDNVKEYDKTTFSMVTPEIKDFLGNYEQAVLYGCETHVCVQQTCLDLLDLGKDVHLVTDGLTSYREGDRTVAIRKMENFGAVLTTSESLIFEIVKDANHPMFKQILKEVLKLKVDEPFTRL